MPLPSGVRITLQQRKTHWVCIAIFLEEDALPVLWVLCKCVAVLPTGTRRVAIAQIVTFHGFSVLSRRTRNPSVLGWTALVVDRISKLAIGNTRRLGWRRWKQRRWRCQRCKSHTVWHRRRNLHLDVAHCETRTRCCGDVARKCGRCHDFHKVVRGRITACQHLHLKNPPPPIPRCHIQRRDI